VLGHLPLHLLQLRPGFRCTFTVLPRRAASGSTAARARGDPAARRRSSACRPRLTVPSAGRGPVLILADRLLATVLHQHLALPQVPIAALFDVRPATISKRIRDIRQLLDHAGYAIEPGSHRLTSLDDLCRFTVAADIVTPSTIKAAC
jgi:hypothetical protein